MTRRGIRASASERSEVSGGSRQESARAVAARDMPGGESSIAIAAERVRRVALGLFAALVTARVYWPSESDPSQASGSGLLWVLAIIVVAGIWVASSLVGGRLLFRYSWTDAAVVALMFLVGLSSTHGQDRRLAINLAWEWGGLGFAYVLARNLPRTRGESTVLAGALVATAVAVSAYGLYQARVEIPALKERFRHNPAQVMFEAKIPQDPHRIRVFTDRLLGSNEVFATFGLANSLAGFLVGPLVLALAMLIRNLADRSAPGWRWGAAGLAAVPLLCLGTCLLLTKSRSSWIGLLAGVSVLAWQERRRVPPRLLLGTGAAGLLVLTALVAAGMVTGRLDREVLTQSSLSMSYRLEYWQGAWGVITGGARTIGQALSSPTFWAGVGPGNFGDHYLLYKLPQSSEEIQDPHDLFLEVWAIAGFWALLALVAALALALENLLGSSRADEKDAPADELPRKRSPVVPRETTGAGDFEELSPPPAGQGWLLVCGGCGLVMVMIVGPMNLFQGDLLTRWLVLLAGWLLAVLLGHAFWRRVPISAPSFGAAIVACVVNLTAAGGIGMSSVALVLWMLIALGLNLRDDRSCGQQRIYEGRLPSAVMAIVWSALLGSFVGAISPFWRSEAALAQADDALAHRPPDFVRAQRAYDEAKIADRYNPRPWLADAYFQLLIWESAGSRVENQVWRKVPTLILKAASAPRNPNSWTLHSERALVIRDLLKKVGNGLGPKQVIPIQASIVEATRTATLLHPSNPGLHARLAEASAEISMFRDAANEAESALRLDKLLTPHPDRRLTEEVRESLAAKLPEWKDKAAQQPLNAR